MRPLVFNKKTMEYIKFSPDHPEEVIASYYSCGQTRTVNPDLVKRIHEEGRITPETARLLAINLGTTVEFWLNVQESYDNWMMRTYGI